MADSSPCPGVAGLRKHQPGDAFCPMHYANVSLEESSVGTGNNKVTTQHCEREKGL